MPSRPGAGALQRQISPLSLPLALVAALGQEYRIVDSLSNRGDGTHLEDSWHRLTCCDSFEGVLCQRRDIVRDDDAPLVGGPLQN